MNNLCEEEVPSLEKTANWPIYLVMSEEDKRKKNVGMVTNFQQKF